ncbi:MAG: helix-turn-helix domain-containing protein [Microcystaceae cyanobacterium]
MATQVLIVEDERLVAQHIAQLLRNNGYEVCGIASEAETALKKIVEFYPDLILLDIRIRGNIDGIEIAEQVQFLYDIPVVYLTAFSDADTLERAQATKPSGYVVKPFRREQLLSSIAITLANHQTEQQARSPQFQNFLDINPLTCHRLQPILAHIQANLEQPITIEFLATAIGMSSAYFCRYFQKETGCSPYQYIIQQRIQKAQILLKQRNLAISDIALQCGFTSHSQLNRHFRKLVGMTPNDYRNS